MTKSYSMLTNIDGKTITVANIIDYAKKETTNHTVKNYHLILFSSTLDNALFRVNFSSKICTGKIAGDHLIIAEAEVCIVNPETFACIRDKIQDIMNQNFAIELDKEYDVDIINEIELKIKKSFATINDFINKFEQEKLVREELTQTLVTSPRKQIVPKKNLKRKFVLLNSDGKRDQDKFFKFKTENLTYLEDLFFSATENTLAKCKVKMSEPKTTEAEIDEIIEFIQSQKKLIFTENHLHTILWIIHYPRLLDKFFGDFCGVKSSLFEIKEIIQQLPLSDQIKLNFQIAQKYYQNSKTSAVPFEFYLKNIQFVNQENLSKMTMEDFNFCYLSLIKLTEIEHEQKKCKDEYEILSNTYGRLKEGFGSLNLSNYMITLSLTIVDFHIKHPYVKLDDETVKKLLSAVNEHIVLYEEQLKQDCNQNISSDIYMHYIIMQSLYNILTKTTQFYSQLLETKLFAEKMNINDSLSYVYYQMGIRLNINNRFALAANCFDLAINIVCDQNILVAYSKIISILDDYLKIVSTKDQENINKIYKFLKESSKQFSAKEVNELKTIRELKATYKQKLDKNNHSRLFKNKHQECIILDEDLTQSEKNKCVNTL